jgi:acetyl esterase
MPVDRDLKPLLEDAERSASDSYRVMGADRARQVVAEQMRGFEAQAEPPREVDSYDTTVPAERGPVPVRLYTPAGEPPRAGIVYMHGGGWTYGSLATHHGIAGRLAERTGATVVSVGYRLSPEAPFPSALDDTVAAVCWTAERCAELGVDPARLAVAGDSAGGNLAIACALKLRDEGGPPLAAQLVFYPQVDATLSQPSVMELADGYMLDRDTILWGVEQYVADESLRAEPLVSPLFADDLAGMPAALVVTGEYDPLRDEGEAYARRLRDWGVLVTHTREPGLLHGFLAFTGISAACKRAERRAFAAAAALLADG